MDLIQELAAKDAELASLQAQVQELEASKETFKKRIKHLQQLNRRMDKSMRAASAKAKAKTRGANNTARVLLPLS